ncbi:hypothetical protein TEK04_02180 [Klenkia sp. LSe6-5]|uniref:LPXTG-motif cell wall anchor domain-containing protein n=1 Tax=Klenkia sesuvii TaxID=3103137 RepID=A0ABU8DNX6_9ACTN
MRAPARRTTIAALLTAGLLVGGAGIAAAADGDTGSTTSGSVASGSEVARTSAPAPLARTAAPTTHTSTHTSTSTGADGSVTTTTSVAGGSSTSEETTTSSSTSTSTSTSEETSTSTSTSEQTSTPPPGPRGSVDAVRGCLGELSVVVSGTELAEGTEVVVELGLPGGPQTVASAVVDGGIPVLVGDALLAGATELTVGVVAGTQAFGPYTVAVPSLDDTRADVCTADATIALARDCTAPDSVLATVDVRGLTAGTYGLAVVGLTPDGGQVSLASADVEVTGTTLTGTLPLVSLTGPVPLAGFAGVALVVEGRTLASVGGGDVAVGACAPPAPLPVAPVAPVAPVGTTAAPTSATGTPAGTVPPTRPAALASTGAQPAGLLLLGGLLLALGGLTTLLTRRAAR